MERIHWVIQLQLLGQPDVNFYVSHQQSSGQVVYLPKYKMVIIKILHCYNIYSQLYIAREWMDEGQQFQCKNKYFIVTSSCGNI